MSSMMFLGLKPLKPYQKEKVDDAAEEDVEKRLRGLRVGGVAEKEEGNVAQEKIEKPKEAGEDVKKGMSRRENERRQAQAAQKRAWDRAPGMKMDFDKPYDNDEGY